MQTTVAEDLSYCSRDDFPIVIATMPASARQKKIALVSFTLLIVVVAITLPFSSVQLARTDTFLPVIQTVMCGADLLSAIFLFAQYRVLPRRALLALASGYMFSGSFAFLQTLAFPGAYAPAGLIGDGLNSAGWLFAFWHTAFLAAVIVYTLLKDEGGAAIRSRKSPALTIGITLACVVAATSGLTWIATAGAGYLPPLFVSTLRGNPLATEVDAFLALVNIMALVLLFNRRRTILDQWLIVTLLAWLPNFIVATLFAVGRFTLGWYISRVYALIAGSSLLFVLLTETLFLYVRLASAMEHQRLLVAELDHRVKNILARVAVAVRHTRQGIGPMQERLEALDGRVNAMADAHSLLSESHWRGVSLSDLVHRLLAPYKTTITGPDIALTPEETQALAMVLQELATNAVKYGALSTTTGRVSVSWDRWSGKDGIPRLAMAWREIGGPPATTPAQPGYGTRLVRGLIPQELGGTVELAFEPDGVCCDIQFPLATR